MAKPEWEACLVAAAALVETQWRVKVEMALEPGEHGGTVNKTLLREPTAADVVKEAINLRNAKYTER